jgi:hypothetical protein
MSVRALDYKIAAKKLNTVREGKPVLILHKALVRYAATDDFDVIAPIGRGWSIARSEDQDDMLVAICQDGNAKDWGSDVTCAFVWSRL